MNYKIKYYWKGSEPEAIITEAQFKKEPKNFDCIFEALVLPTSGEACFKVLGENDEILCSGSSEEISFHEAFLYSLKPKQKEEIRQRIKTQILKRLFEIQMEHKQEAILNAWQYFKTESDEGFIIPSDTKKRLEKWQIRGKTASFFSDNEILMSYQFKYFSPKYNSFIAISSL